MSYRDIITATVRRQLLHCCRRHYIRYPRPWDGFSLTLLLRSTLCLFLWFAGATIVGFCCIGGIAFNVHRSGKENDWRDPEKGTWMIASISRAWSTRSLQYGLTMMEEHRAITKKMLGSRQCYVHSPNIAQKTNPFASCSSHAGENHNVGFPTLEGVNAWNFNESFVARPKAIGKRTSQQCSLLGIGCYLWIVIFFAE